MPVQMDRINPKGVAKEIYALGYGVKADGLTDDTTALQAALNAGGQNSKVILPSGTLLLSQAASIFVYDGQWICGAGKFATTVKRANSVNSGLGVFSIAAGGGFGTVGNVQFTDFTIDGNQANQTTGADLINGGATSKLTIQRMRLINAWNNAVGLFPSGGNATTDALIANCDFEGTGIRAGGGGLAACSDLHLGQSLRVRVIGNRSDNSQNFAVLAANTGLGQVAITNNIVNGCLGFAVALGGGPASSTNVNISGNIFNCPTSTQNIVDTAAWNDVTVNNNVVVMGTANSGIGDAPPSLRLVVTNNVIIGNSVNTNPIGSAITVGGSDTIISGNLCRDLIGRGINLTIASSGAQSNVLVENNIVRNYGKAGGAFTMAGIELFVAGGGTGALANILIKGNRVYDLNQTLAAGYGIGLAVVGQTTGYSNITVEGNDLRGNKTAALLNSTSGMTGYTVKNNPGVNPFGAVTALGFPASNAVVTNDSGFDCTVYVTSGTNAITAVAIGGTTLTGITVPAGGGTNVFRVPALQTIKLTYVAGGSPSWQWIAE